MLRYCLSKEEISRFLEVRYGLPEYAGNVDLTALLEEWACWGVELGCMCTGLSQVLENRQGVGEDVVAILKDLYQLSQQVGLFSVESIDARFIAYMLENVRDPEVPIEDDLISLSNSLYERGY